MENPEYLRHQLNNSVSKQTYSFMKSLRFKTEQSKDNHRFYQLPSTRTQRTTSLGYGNKLISTQKSVSPPPNNYDTRILFTKSPKNAISFASGREEVIFNGFMGNLKKARKSIGPNNYRIKNNCFSKRGGFIGSKLPTQIDELKKRQCPGPGTYNFKGSEMNKSGSYFLSGLKNHISPRYHTTTSYSSLIKNNKGSSIGPGQYLSKEEFGKSVTSKFRNSASNSFSKSERRGLADKSKSKIPSFQYKSFSEFGMSI